MADDDAIELIKQSVRGALHGQTFIAGHTIDEVTDRAVDAVLVHRESVLRALGGIKLGQDALTPGEHKTPVAMDVWAFLPREK